MKLEPAATESPAVWGAHAPRVPNPAPRRIERAEETCANYPAISPADGCGEAPQPAREARALPRRESRARRNGWIDQRWIHGHRFAQSA
jgi:hypothetical protein